MASKKNIIVDRNYLWTIEKFSRENFQKEFLSDEISIQIGDSKTKW